MNTDFKLNKTSKMNAFSFSLDARNCVTGSKLRKIKGSVCEKCYAFKGRYPTPSVRKNRETNLQHFNNKYFVEVMAFKLQHQKFFRWFDSGDLPNMEGLKKIVKIAELTPDTKHWLPTREIKLIQQYLKKNTFLSNNNSRLVLNSIFFLQPYEVIFRSLSESIKMIGKKYYSARGKKIDKIINHLKKSVSYRSTLGGCIIEKVNETVIISREQ